MDLLFELLPLLALVALMVWLITSQRRRQREVVGMQASLVAGDEVVTAGGLIGRLVAAEGPVLSLEIAQGVVVRIDRRTVSGRTSDVPAFAGVAGAKGSAPVRHDTQDDQGASGGSTAAVPPSTTSTVDTPASGRSAGSLSDEQD